MSMTVYLMQFVDPEAVPPVIVGAGLYSKDVLQRTLSWYGRKGQVLEASGKTLTEAEKKIFDWLRHPSTCPHGDFSYLLPFVERKEEAHQGRHELAKRITKVQEFLKKLKP